MNDFIASNGCRVNADVPNRVVIFDDDGDNTLEEYDHLDTRDMQALREFFRAEEDARLGRWRWPENPDYVVYPKGGRIAQVFCEKDGYFFAWSEAAMKSADHYGGHARKTAEAARAYFDAHPEPKPAWHDATDGETWVLTVNGTESAWAFRKSEWERISDGSLLRGAPGSPAISAGRRIWPEVAS